MKITKKVLCILLAVCMIITFAACTKTNDNGSENQNNDQTNNVGEESKSVYPLTFKDDLDNEVTLEKAPEKIASGAPSITETIYAIGKDNLLVGVTEYCNYPEDTKNKQVIGGYTGPNIEKLLELDVDLFISDKIKDDDLKTLKDAGIQVVIVNAKGYEDTFKKIEFIGNMLDAKDKAIELVSAMKDKEKEILDKIKGEDSKTAFYEVWNDPLQTAGPGSFIDDLITLANCENIAHDAESAYAEFSLEKLIEENPQVYLSADDGFKTVDDIKGRVAFEEIDAIKNNQIYLLDQDISSRPGPRIVEALELVAKAIHPEAFK
ncbi:ABC transporter substrate-binding protein [Sedimentibacter sp. zth1]|uniref:ABC transporter substrate-binding protein n=1 Tax=Sedimentibacter sp. zth1 TaxID=2816908 RepID=UPI001A932B60|nr:ABC transporter substrate-binding protein [Sedimentibacter sp. zth1]QSX06052.1 ABC transporter substrate-binding protein [Sedimentibacter sp. zth1]